MAKAERTSSPMAMDKPRGFGNCSGMNTPNPAKSVRIDQCMNEIAIPSYAAAMTQYLRKSWRDCITESTCRTSAQRRT